MVNYYNPHPCFSYKWATILANALSKDRNRYFTSIRLSCGSWVASDKYAGV